MPRRRALHTGAVTSHRSDPLSWVALDSWDVDPADLVAPGRPWADVIPTDVDNRIDNSIGPLPTQGWREVMILPPDPAAMPGRLFVAPDGDGWAVAYLSPPLGEGKPILSAGPAVSLRPGKPARRQGLRLTWPTGVEVRASELQGLQITLTNAGDVAWVADPQDTQYAHGWLLDRHGHRIGSSTIYYGGTHHAIDELAPGEGLPLPVSFGPDPQLTAPGVYQVQAVMPALNLWSPRSNITVLP